MATTHKLLCIDINEEIIELNTAVAEDANSRFLDVKLTDSGVPISLVEHTIRVSCVKPDGWRVFNNCEITDATNGRFQVELTNQMLAVAGKLEMQLHVFGENETQILSTKVFFILVERNLLDWEAVESTNEFGAAVILFQDVAAIRSLMYSHDEYVREYLDAKVSSIASSISKETIAQAVEDALLELSSTGQLIVSLPRTRLMTAGGASSYGDTVALVWNTGKGYLVGLSASAGASSGSGVFTISTDGGEPKQFGVSLNASGVYAPLFVRYTSSLEVWFRGPVAGMVYSSSVIMSVEY